MTPDATNDKSENHAKSKDADAPPSVEAMLSASDLDDLFRDLAACVELQHIAVKTAPDQANASPAPPELPAARELLGRPEIHAVQLRYTYQENLWIDTLTKRDGSYHLLRIQHAQ